jgi:RNA polymerase sigma-70 factor (ECF subfamily)
VNKSKLIEMELPLNTACLSIRSGGIMAEDTSTEQDQGEDPDYILIQRIASGDASALDELYARHGSGVLSYLTSYLNDRQLAEEILQDVMLAVWNNASSFRGDSKVRTWILVIARNRAINSRRKQSPHFVALEDNINNYSSDTSPLEKIVRLSQHEALRKAIGTLPEVHREILVLVFFNQLSGPEVADVLKISIGTVKSRLHRAKDALRRSMQMMGDISDAQ